ncbi:hypothetical protein SUDANB121_02808 [Nocardiopsis dassonvillei]
MWTLRAHPGWERRELRAQRPDHEAEEERETSGERCTDPAARRPRP